MKKITLIVVFCMLFLINLSFAAMGDSNSDSNISLGYAKPAYNLGNGEISLDQVAARYWISKDFGLDVALGFRTGDAATAVLLTTKVIGNFYTINKLNIYWLGGISLGSYDPKIEGLNAYTVFRAQGGVGVEYYILPCLSVLTELGIHFTSLIGNDDNRTDFGVVADWLPQAGIRVYFY